jgi:hypothetical protein
MTTTAKGSFALSSWDEDAYEEFDEGRKLTRATVGQAFTGDIDGEGGVQWLMSYRTDGTARFVGMQRVTGEVGGRRGSFVMETVGEFDGKVAAADWSVVDGSGTEELAGITGNGRFEAPMGSEATFSLDYDLDAGS